MRNVGRHGRLCCRTYQLHESPQAHVLDEEAAQEQSAHFEQPNVAAAAMSLRGTAEAAGGLAGPGRTGADSDILWLESGYG